MRSALIVDDHPLFCDALSMTLKAFVGIADIETASSLDIALDKLAGGVQPDVIVLDLNLPDVSGLDGLMRLRRQAGATPIVVVSSLADPKVIGAALGFPGQLVFFEQGDVLVQGVAAQACDGPQCFAGWPGLVVFVHEFGDSNQHADGAGADDGHFL